jgi:hypothetical protein
MGLFLEQDLNLSLSLSGLELCFLRWWRMGAMTIHELSHIVDSSSSSSSSSSSGGGGIPLAL